MVAHVVSYLPSPAKDDGDATDENLLISSEIAWSPCGLYVDISHRTSEGIEDRGDSVYGRIWDAKTRRTVYHWPCPGGHPDENKVIRPPKGKACLVLNHDPCTLMSLTDDANCWGPYTGPQPDCDSLCDRMGFSPCARLLYLWKELTAPGAQLSDEERQELAAYRADPIRSCCPKSALIYKLWLGSVSLDPTGISPAGQALTSVELDMDSIAWHPSPVSDCTFAAVDISGTLMLFQGSPLHLIQSWDAHDLARKCFGKAPDHLCFQRHLAWSPDGSQLAYRIHGAIALLSFGCKEP